jgi:hypothetical protein
MGGAERGSQFRQRRLTGGMKYGRLVGLMNAEAGEGRRWTRIG